VSAFFLTKISIKLYKKDIRVQRNILGALPYLSYPLIFISTIAIFLTSLFYTVSLFGDSSGLSGIPLAIIMIPGFSILFISWVLMLAGIDWQPYCLKDKDRKKENQESLDTQESRKKDKLSPFVLIPFGALAFIAWYIIASL
jgi:amino acid permease